MFDVFKPLFTTDDAEERPVEIDKNLAAATLLVHVMAVDGQIRPEEEEKLTSVLEKHYAVSSGEAEVLDVVARKVHAEAIDLFSFTRILKREMNEKEREALIEDLWEMVFADGRLHEFEDNVVWRVAELIGINTKRRMFLKQRVLARLN